MCCEGKCFGCIKVETGSMIFAVFNAVSSILTVIGSVIAILIYYFQNNYYNYQAQFGDIKVAANNFDDMSLQMGNYGISTRQFDDARRYQNYAVYTTCGILIGAGLLNFLFAVILCNGVNKRNPGQIKAYLIYGIVMAVLNSIAVLILGFISGIILIILAIPIVVYCFILHMIKLTMDKFTSGNIYGFHHTRFDDTTQIIKP